jgi:hypothetical protein
LIYDEIDIIFQQNRFKVRLNYHYPGGVYQDSARRRKKKDEKMAEEKHAVDDPVCSVGYHCVCV